MILDYLNIDILLLTIISILISTLTYFMIKKTKIMKEKAIITCITIIYSLFAFSLLGSNSLPTTFYEPKENEYLIFEALDETSFDTIYAISGEGNNINGNYRIGMQDVDILGSNDLNNFEKITTINQKDFFKWEIIPVNADYKYLKIQFNNPYSLINEIGFKNNDHLLKYQLIDQSYPSNLDYKYLFDEQHKIVFDPTYYNETYFDEIYHIRNAYEISEGQYMYASVHPLLGTSFIALGIKIFGMNMFGARFMGTLFSILMLPLFYCTLKTLLKNTRYATIGTILLATDFMHYTTGRIGTLEPFSVFSIILMYYFMIKYLNHDFYDTNLRKLLTLLALCGFCMGLSWSIKWTGIYASVGLALLFFIHLYKQYKIQKQKPDQILHDTFKKYTTSIILWCIIWFCIIPVIIYFIAYLPCKIYPNNQYGYIEGIIRYTLGIFNYHANLNATHPFQSMWYEWILDIKPIWYYVKDTSIGIYTISCFNNPLINWLGIGSIIYCIYDYFKKNNQTSLIIIIGYFTSLIPWMFIDRCIFQYHYYPSIPFLIMAIVYMFKQININNKYNRAIKIYTLACIILFIIFLPVIGGFLTSHNYINKICRWFQTWYFG